MSAPHEFVPDASRGVGPGGGRCQHFTAGHVTPCGRPGDHEIHAVRAVGFGRRCVDPACELGRHLCGWGEPESGAFRKMAEAAKAYSRELHRVRGEGQSLRARVEEWLAGIDPADELLGAQIIDGLRAAIDGPQR